MNEDGIPMKVLNMKLTEKCPRHRPRSGWEQQVMKDVTQKEGLVTSPQLFHLWVCWTKIHTYMNTDLLYQL
jgi:hypothetical protein